MIQITKFYQKKSQKMSLFLMILSFLLIGIEFLSLSGVILDLRQEIKTPAHPIDFATIAVNNDINPIFSDNYRSNLNDLNESLSNLKYFPLVQNYNLNFINNFSINDSHPSYSAYGKETRFQFLYIDPSILQSHSNLLSYSIEISEGTFPSADHELICDIRFKSYGYRIGDELYFKTNISEGKSRIADQLPDYSGNYLGKEYQVTRVMKICGFYKISDYDTFQYFSSYGYSRIEYLKEIQQFWSSSISKEFAFLNYYFITTFHECEDLLQTMELNNSSIKTPFVSRLFFYNTERNDLAIDEIIPTCDFIFSELPKLHPDLDYLDEQTIILDSTYHSKHEAIHPAGNYFYFKSKMAEITQLKWDILILTIIPLIGLCFFTRFLIQKEWDNFIPDIIRYYKLGSTPTQLKFEILGDKLKWIALSQTFLLSLCVCGRFLPNYLVTTVIQLAMPSILAFLCVPILFTGIYSYFYYTQKLTSVFHAQFNEIPDLQEYLEYRAHRRRFWKNLFFFMTLLYSLIISLWIFYLRITPREDIPILFRTYNLNDARTMLFFTFPLLIIIPISIGLLFLKYLPNLIRFINIHSSRARSLRTLMHQNMIPIRQMISHHNVFEISALFILLIGTSVYEINLQMNHNHTNNVWGNADLSYTQKYVYYQFDNAPLVDPIYGSQQLENMVTQLASNHNITAGYIQYFRELQYTTIFSRPQAIFMNVSKYLNYISQNKLISTISHSDVKILRKLLEDPSHIIISQATADYFEYQLGDNLCLTTGSSGAPTRTFHIIGIMDYLPLCMLDYSDKDTVSEYVGDSKLDYVSFILSEKAIALLNRETDDTFYCKAKIFLDLDPECDTEDIINQLLVTESQVITNLYQKSPNVSIPPLFLVSFINAFSYFLIALFCVSQVFLIHQWLNLTKKDEMRYYKCGYPFKKYRNNVRRQILLWLIFNLLISIVLVIGLKLIILELFKIGYSFEGFVTIPRFTGFIAFMDNTFYRTSTYNTPQDYGIPNPYNLNARLAWNNLVIIISTFLISSVVVFYKTFRGTAHDPNLN